ncbi:hypothetical protein NZD89_14095 [Alicyclobacillus fastidiosus]|uniref:Uncharacterized protein n=1 Tax=Alicyclobacillus fastidiosus TaxID=392011 RepID=A0ABY6ZNG6_9BACL|nr:hypothetical protein [Alicyclobacillus fastidiosus]WAH44419.1 hypothetical protein NZD89_14095 [Alicyclobacillus fastidiosus]GMA60759.1 hypothetical protein GCM10025859_11990 [Alicyclobacillus fastidiosus]
MKKGEGNKNIIITPDAGVSNAFFGGNLHYESFVMADGYGTAAIHLASNAYKENERDTWLYPTLYLFRHYVELTWKDIYIKWKALIDEEVTPEELQGHKLSNKSFDGLWTWLLSNWPKEDRAKPNRVKRIIVDLHKLDKTGQAFRYNQDVNGRVFRGAETQLIGYNELVQKMEDVKCFFDGLQGWIGHMLDIKAEMGSEGYNE